MKKLYFSLFCLISFVFYGQTPILTAIVDGDCGGDPKVLEIYASGEVDFSLYSLQNQKKGEDTWKNTQVLTTLGTVTEGFVYITKDANLTKFNAEFPSLSTANILISNVIDLDGDDRIRIIEVSTTTVIDQYGVEGVDGSGTSWEYKDSYAKRIDGTGPDGGFIEANWTIPGKDSLKDEGTCNGGSTIESIMGGIGNFNNVTTPITLIPDPNFEQALIDLGIDSDGVINQSVFTADISGVTSLNVSNKIISDLTGIEDFASLTVLRCDTNQLNTLDLSQNTALTALTCHSNQLTSLDVTQNTALTSITCYANQLVSLDVTKNTGLTYLHCATNQLASLDVSLNTALTYLRFNDNQVPSINVTNIPGLTYLNCGTNLLTSLDVSQNTVLETLATAFNQIPSLDLSPNTALTLLYCNNNQLTSLNVTQNTALTFLHCYSNQLTSLNVSLNTLLTELHCGTNQITSLDVSLNTALTYLRFNDNQVPSINVTNIPGLTYLNCSTNLLTSLDISQNTVLETLATAFNQIPSLDLSLNTALTLLYCNNNQLTSLNVKNGNNALITTFNAQNNLPLACIDVDNEADANAGNGSYSTWLKDAAATYSEDCSTLNVDDELLAQGITFYPNPVSHILIIDSEISLKKVEIYSVLGKKVKEIKSNFESIPMGNLSDGIYIVRMHSENGFTTKKLIKINK